MPAAWSGEGSSAPEIVVRGGSRGLTVEYRELESVAAAMEDVVSRLTTLRTGCTEIYLLLNRTSALYANAHQAVDAAEHVIRGLRRNTEELEEAAADLRAAAGNYLGVEDNLAQAIPWRVRAPLGLALWGQGGWGFPNRAESELMMPEHDRLAIEVLLGLLASGKYGKLRPVEIHQVEGDHGSVVLDGTASAMLERSKVLLDGTDKQGPGVVEILTGYRNGKPVRVVTLPGTQDSGNIFVGANPFDNYGNAEGRAEDSQYIADAVAEALRQAGASAEDSVILVGYSQGGIHAVNTAARLAEGGEFSVEMVVTAGAPAGDRSTPDGVKVLHFEHRQDWVPGMDGTANPDTPDRTTVTGMSAVEDEGNGGLGPGHSLDTYQDLAGQADLSEDPSLKDSLGHLAEIIPPGTIATRSLFRFSRKPASKPQEPQQPPARKPWLEPVRSTPLLEPVRSLPWLERVKSPPNPLFPPLGAGPQGPQAPRPFLPLPEGRPPLLPARPGQ